MRWKTTICVSISIKVKRFLTNHNLILLSVSFKRVTEFERRFREANTVLSSANKMSFKSDELLTISVIERRHSVGLTMLPCGTPKYASNKEELMLSLTTYWFRA